MTSLARVCVLLVCCLSQTTVADHLEIQNNRYNNLVIAISPEITEDHAIIEELVNMTKEASVFLYEATRNRAYFGHVKILVPETWTPDPSWGQSTVETFEEANIRVDKPHPSFGPNPYTFQPEGCGVPAKYIHLTEEYVLDEHGDREQNWGPPGRTIVHEFAHLRYGVFDEYGLGTKEYPNFYIDDTIAYPTACTYSIRGHTVGKCDQDPATNLPKDPKCFFLGDVKQDDAKVSIMYDPTIETMTTFCESDTNDPDMTHNVLAPNQQNKMCNKKGTWDIIKNHMDFKVDNLPVNKSLSDLEPTFTIIQSSKNKTSTGAEVCGRPVVLVLDVSGSMSGTRIFKQKQTADKLIEDILPIGTKVGVVSFSNTANTLFPLTTISTLADRNRAANSVPQYASGGTGIGSGLLKAREMLKDAGALQDGRIVLITDGEENQSPYVNSVMGQFTSTGIRIHSLAYSRAAATAIRSLSVQTGGQYAYFSESATSTVLDAAMQHLLKDISICNHVARVEITRVSDSLSPNADVGRDVFIDETLANDTMFVFTLPQGATVTVTLLSPDGKRFNSSSQEYSIDSSLNIVRFNFKQAKVGKWHYTLRSSSPGYVSVVVKALPATSDPYETSSWLSSTAADLGNSDSATVVYVYVHKGYSPVIYADVTVTVERPQGDPVTLKPQDDGILPDNLANDGVYASYFTQYSGNERYSLDVAVRSIPGKTSYIKHGNSTYGAAMRRDRDNTQPVETELTSDFTRSGFPGAMDVSGFVAGKDHFAPSRVTDLSVTAFSTESSTVTLTWTAPGDDLYQGTATSYELRMSKSLKLLTNSFDKCLVVDLAMLKEGSLTPKPAKSRERVVIQAPENWTTIFFGLRTLDEADHVSDMSNFITATFKKVTFQGEMTPAAFPEPISDGPEIGIIVAVVCGLLGGALIIAVVVCVLCRPKRGNSDVDLLKKPTLGRPNPQATAPAVEKLF